MKQFLLILCLFMSSLPIFAQDVYVPEDVQQTEELFSDDLYIKLLNSMRKRYANKDVSTIKLRKDELEKILRRRSKLDSKTRQRLEIEWLVIQENLMKPIIQP